MGTYAYQVLLDGTLHGSRLRPVGRRQRKQLEDLLGDEDLLVQIAVADGAREGQYARRSTSTTSSSAQPRAKRRCSGSPSRWPSSTRCPTPSATRLGCPTRPSSWIRSSATCTSRSPTSRASSIPCSTSSRSGTIGWCRRRGAGRDPRLGRETLRNYRPDHIAKADTRRRQGTRPQRDPLRVAGQQVRPRRPSFSEHSDERRRLREARLLRALHPAGLTPRRPQRGHAVLAH